MKAVISLIRVNNWIKNLFIFIPLFFSADLFDYQKLSLTIIVFIGFCFITSFVYIINDIFDKKFDKNHPTKYRRAIASGRVSISYGIAISLFFLISGCITIYIGSIECLLLSIVYVLLNIAYSYKLKKVAIIDMIIIAIGFIIRLFIGAYVGEIELTQWIVLLVFLLSLFIAIAKRRDDVYIFENDNKVNRDVVRQYSVNFMDMSMTMISSILIMSYLLFISSAEVIERYENDYLYVTFFPVLIGILRYNQIVYVFNKGGSPIKIIFKDIFLQLCVISWIVIFSLIIYNIPT